MSTLPWCRRKTKLFKKGEEKIMAVMDGCEAQFTTPVLEERTCPKCGEIVEVFTRKGRIIDDTACSCGYVFKAEAQLESQARKTK